MNHRWMTSVESIDRLIVVSTGTTSSLYEKTVVIVSLAESGYSKRHSHCWPIASMSSDSAESSASAWRASPVMTTPKTKIATATAPRAAPTRPMTPRPAVRRRGSVLPRRARGIGEPRRGARDQRDAEEYDNDQHHPVAGPDRPPRWASAPSPARWQRPPGPRRARRKRRDREARPSMGRRDVGGPHGGAILIGQYGARRSPGPGRVSLTLGTVAGSIGSSLSEIEPAAGSRGLESRTSRASGVSGPGLFGDAPPPPIHAVAADVAQVILGGLAALRRWHVRHADPHSRTYTRRARAPVPTITPPVARAAHRGPRRSRRGGRGVHRPAAAAQAASDASGPRQRGRSPLPARRPWRS